MTLAQLVMAASPARQTIMQTGTIASREQEIVEAFSAFDDWIGKYEYLIEQGRSLPLIEEAYRTDAYRIQNCQVQVWLRAELREGRVFYRADSDARITKGLLALLVRILSGQSAADVTGADLGFLDRIGLREHLSFVRKNGLVAFVQMQHYARAAAGAPITEEGPIRSGEGHPD
jgi:cysteine desulfuration protein SufE